jgi:hypothetical protein
MRERELALSLAIFSSRIFWFFFFNEKKNHAQMIHQLQKVTQSKKYNKGTSIHPAFHQLKSQLHVKLFVEL